MCQYLRQGRGAGGLIGRLYLKQFGQTGRSADRQTGRPADQQTGRRAYRQMDRRTNGQTNRAHGDKPGPQKGGFNQNLSPPIVLKLGDHVILF